MESSFLALAGRTRRANALIGVRQARPGGPNDALRPHKSHRPRRMRQHPTHCVDTQDMEKHRKERGRSGGAEGGGGT